jgi:hypothetical protein
MQRGGFSDATFGSITGELSALMVSQASESSEQFLDPYKSFLEYMLSVVSDGWMREAITTPKAFSAMGLTEIEIEALTLLQEVTNDIGVKVTYSVQIPGDLAQRVIMAKQGSSQFDISRKLAYTLFMPEVTDVETAMAEVEAERAKMHESYSTALVIKSLTESSRRLTGSDPQLAGMFGQKAGIAPQQSPLGQSAVQPSASAISLNPIAGTLGATNG